MAAVTLGAAVLFYSASPAQADVDSVAGSATAIRIGGNPLVPGVSGSATEPTDGYGPFTTGPVGAPGLPLGLGAALGIGILTAETDGGGVAGENHLGFAHSRASVADVVIGGSAIGVVTSECRADGNGATGTTAIVGGGTLPANPLPNTPATIGGLIPVTLNEQTVTNVAGTATISIIGLHVQLLGLDIRIS
ncbi:MAG TPA: choice-of-anchor P family protein, partial [Acidimicrobiales bacterium]|nr:choice-of-anchor P family protein [Acidimicrobiales bacterium]